MGLAKSSRYVQQATLLICFYISAAMGASSYWLANINHQGEPAYGSSNSYPVFRNVQDYGAVGDGVNDDTASINNAISVGSRCGNAQCSSSTTTPAIIYFPPGTYRVTSPIVMYYFSDLVGDPLNPPTLLADHGFSGIAVLDSDVYIPNGYGAEWYGNTNNFYRKVRNFVIDLSQMDFSSSSAGIHWQVAQATSLQNIVFKMKSGGGASNKQQGIFMENGSGGFMSDLRFEGGNYGAFFGSQQFTTRNLTFVGCRTAIYMNFNWLWTFSGLTITGATLGIDISNSINPTAGAGVGSLLVMDSSIQAGTGILTRYGDFKNDPRTAGSIILENVDFSQTSPAIMDLNNKVILNGLTVVGSFGQGNAYTTVSTPTGCTVQNATLQREIVPVSRQSALVDSSGKYFQKSKPQYESVLVINFLSAKSFGCKGDGVTDDTLCVQNFLNIATSSNRIAFFDHGAYVISSTVNVPPGTRIVGEVWPTIMASGNYFANQNNPQPVFSIGNPGDTGAVEISDIIFSSIGPVPGAIMVQWNLAQSSNGAAGMWDVHFRIGGALGTQMQSNNCLKTPGVTTSPNPACEGAFLLLHVTPTGSLYLENIWAWVADHELDLGGEEQINIYNGRGILIESKAGPVWLWGTSSEHSVLYNYQVSQASNVFMGLIQTETAYMQGNPSALVPFAPQTAFTDPTFCGCPNTNCTKTWGLRIVDSTHVYAYGAGLYSFFDNYNSGCLADGNCQTNIVDILGSSSIYIWDLTTIASRYMVTLQGQGVVDWDANLDIFGQTILVFEVPDTCVLPSSSSSLSCAATSIASSSSIPLLLSSTSASSGASSDFASSTASISLPGGIPISGSSSASAGGSTGAGSGGGGGSSGSSPSVGLPGGSPTSDTATVGGPVIVTSGSDSVQGTTTVDINAPGPSGGGTITVPANPPVVVTTGSLTLPGATNSSSPGFGGAGGPSGGPGGGPSGSLGITPAPSVGGGNPLPTTLPSDTNGLRTFSGTLVGSGVISGSGCVSATGTISASGSMSGTGVITSGTFVTSGIISTIGTIDGSGTISLCGSVVGTGYVSGVGTLSGSAYISSFSSTSPAVTPGLSATGTLSATGQIDATGTLTSGPFSTGGVVSRTGASVSGVAGISGSGTATGTATATGTITGSGYLSGSGTIDATGYISATGVLNGSGYISSAGFERSGYISRSGTVIGSGIIRGMAMSIEGRGYVSGSGTATGMGYISAGGLFPSATSFGGGSYGTTVVVTVLDCAAAIAGNTTTSTPTIPPLFPLPTSASANATITTTSPTASPFLLGIGPLRQGQLQDSNDNDRLPDPILFPPPAPPPSSQPSTSLNRTLGADRLSEFNSIIGSSANNPACPLCPGDVAICCHTACGGDGKCPLDAVRNGGWIAPGGYEIVGLS